MKKAGKDRAQNFMKLLIQAQDKLGELMKEQEFHKIQILLEDCQEAAVALGTFIEQSEGSGFAAVSFLEEYCELAYRLHEEFSGAQTDAGKIYQSMKRKLVKAENSIRNDIPIRKEAVFLPYKASMWDSLESVWRAADADPDCDAYVIPIPYYDRNPDGSFAKMHYEGGLYPKDVPVIDYQDYDLEEHHPDFIFIHNPYDNSNLVTSVEPFFYASNLKKYTDRLVYIPYFVLGEIDPRNKSAVDNIAHFIIVPGVWYADTVIVQSENMRQAYIDVLTEYAGEKTRPDWEKRILGLGSPKLDKAVNAKVSEEEIPEDWKPLLYRPDGTKKKVVFYNTSLTALLNESDRYLGKMQDVFQTFRSFQNEVTLLWRPHPLIQATISSMRPKLWEGYQKLMRQYRKEGWGIYDDSAELDRAIALSDAYYGDTSSVVQLCRAKGMPVMIQSVLAYQNLK